MHVAVMAFSLLYICCILAYYWIAHCIIYRTIPPFFLVHDCTLTKFNLFVYTCRVDINDKQEWCRDELAEHLMDARV